MNRRKFLLGSLSVAGAASVARSAHALDTLPAAVPSQSNLTSEVEAEIARAVFPKNFMWGSATASYQVEAARKADGKGESIWDRFAHTPSIIKGAATGDVACDQYNLYKQDIALMKTLGLKSYRFSIAWPRIQPTGTGPVNAKGLDHYKRLTDELLAAGIRPMCTLYHWDLPQALEDKGGWPNRDTAAHFTEYAQIIAKALGDRIETWAIFNEPWVFTMLGYGNGIHAPGKKDFGQFLKASHTVNIAQGEAFRAMKAIAPKAKIGSAFSMSPAAPKTNSEADKAAAARFHAMNNIWFVDTALHGKYPDAFVNGVPYEALGFKPGDDKLMRAPLDWMGINYYNRSILAAEPVKPDAPVNFAAMGFNQSRGMEGPITDNGWEVWPKGIYDIVMQITREYNKPIIEITENGCAYGDGPDVTGRIPDKQRIDFYLGHLAELGRAIHDGADVRGYHAWSLMDNFEWAEGYSQRFGLVYVDYRDQRRIVKDSGHWYSRVAKTNKLA
ncbi:MAG: GH1 family beta-glucosidase [Acidobacteriaceae bacterium]